MKITVLSIVWKQLLNGMQEEIHYRGFEIPYLHEEN